MDINYVNIPMGITTIQSFLPKELHYFGKLETYHFESIYKDIKEIDRIRFLFVVFDSIYIVRGLIV